MRQDGWLTVRWKRFLDQLGAACDSAVEQELVEPIPAEPESRLRQKPAFFPIAKMELDRADHRRRGSQKLAPNPERFECQLDLRREELAANLVTGKMRFFKNADFGAFSKGG